ncbi:transposase family protein [Paraburkholderia fungorum]|uniref:Transposase family protein n=1 Tax=Paraburkholderia fungorum TaxID=134537 RepID=A0AAU8SSZ0_9BURK|nr:transposase family protein [Paraburkholderia fungorum]
MDYATLVGIDLGKQTFHVHGQDSKGKAVFRKKFGRRQLIEFLATCHSCTVVMEACAGSHFMARKLSSLGHEVKLISPQFVRPFVKSNKNDFIDAEAICEAASRPAMRFGTPKTESQQTLSVLHRVRESMVQDRTRTINQMHGFLLEFGVSLPAGKTGVPRLPEILDFHPLPPRLVAILKRLHEHFKYLQHQIGEIDRELALQLADDDAGQRLMGIPGVGPITASVLASEIGDGTQFKCGRDLQLRLALCPDSTVSAENPTFSELVAVAIATSEAFLCSAPGHTCAFLIDEPGPSRNGPARWPAGVIRTSWRARWPISWPESHGR